MRLGLVSCALLAVCGAFVAPVRADWQCREPFGLAVSGAAWSATLDRYLVLTDGGAEGERARLFALNAGGQLDSLPILSALPPDIRTVRALASGPNGSFFALMLPPSDGPMPRKQRLLQLGLDVGRTARLISALDLNVEALRAASPASASPGIVTGLAFQDDVVYLAVEAPPVSGAAATIFELSHLTAVMASGVIPRGALSVWATPSFCGARNACERISDLAADGAGGLLVATQWPGKSAAEVSETLWRLPRAAAAPQEIKRFDGLGAARLALSSDRSSAILLFDSGDRRPLWLSWRLPP